MGVAHRFDIYSIVSGFNDTQLTWNKCYLNLPLVWVNIPSDDSPPAVLLSLLHPELARVSALGRESSGASLKSLIHSSSDFSESSRNNRRLAVRTAFAHVPV